MGTEGTTDSGQADNESTVRETFHGFYSTLGRDEVHEMHECTLFITDEELVIGDQGEYEVLGGIPDKLPEPADKITRKIFADDSAETIALDTASKRNDTKTISLTDIDEIETEKQLPSNKQLIEVEYNINEASIYIGTAKSHGGKDETQAFVSALESAATDAGGAPRVTSEFDL